MMYDALELNRIQEQVARYCNFTGSRELVLTEEPSFSKLVVQLQLNRMKEALQCTYRYGAMPFFGLRDIRRAVVVAAKNGICTPHDLLEIAQHETCVASCQSYVNKCEVPVDGLRDLTESLTRHEKIAREIERCISQSYEVNDGASAKLASLRKSIRMQMNRIDTTLQQFIQTHSSALMDNISAVRNDRAVVLVKKTYKNQFDGIQYGESASGQAVYTEPGVMIPLNNQLQDLRQKEQQEVERILSELSDMVGQVSEEYLANVETLSLLDMIFAKATYGKEMDGCVATLSNDDALYLKKVRHPLIAKEKVVANTYHISPPYSTLLITGPNTGGKTVSLKVIGLSVLMTYCGIPVPCEEASIPMYDQLFVDIGDAQSIEQSLSTFSGHMARLSTIFAKATRKSLVILDELCSGTDPKEGENLAIAILEYFRKQNIFVIATTHYSKLKLYGKQHEDILLASVAFDLEKLQPTYRYQEGFTGQSNAFDIAYRYGFRKDIIDFAKQLKAQDTTEQEILMDKLEKQLQQQQNLVVQLEMQKRENEKLQEDLLQKQRMFMEQEDALMQKAKEQASQYLQSIEEEAKEIIEELKQRDSYKMHESIETLRDIHNLQEEPEDWEQDHPNEEISEGDTVRIVSTNVLGKVISLKGKQAMVLANGIKMKVNKDGLHKERVVLKEKKKESISYRRHASFSIECNLIGMRVDEAMVELSKYLDDAILANVSFVRIIHGHGTGALRKAVWDSLKKCKYVKSYRLGGMSEGGSGATVVMLKE